MKNIVLIGMPASGKTTVSEMLSEISGMEKYDTDAYLEEKEHRLIKEIFSEFGEEYFRDLEEKYTCELSRKNGVLISTGGGVIKREVNINNLKNNGIIIFLDRSPLEISKEDHTLRPLLQDKANIEKLYSERYHLYEKYADYIIKNDGTPEQAVESILKIINEVKWWDS